MPPTGGGFSIYWGNCLKIREIGNGHTLTFSRQANRGAVGKVRGGLTVDYIKSERKAFNLKARIPLIDCRYFLITEAARICIDEIREGIGRNVVTTGIVRIFNA